jgi:hypothetical protein
MQKIRIYASAANFFLRTQAAGYDPEGSSLDKNISLVPNVDALNQPAVKTKTK